MSEAGPNTFPSLIMELFNSSVRAKLLEWHVDGKAAGMCKIWDMTREKMKKWGKV